MLTRPPPAPRDARGLPVAEPREERVARRVAIAASVFFALAAAWEMFGPVLAGHYASSASVGIMAENILRWHILGPVWEYTAQKPVPAQWYCHHPFGIEWTTALLMAIFGRHDFVCRLAPVLLSSASPPLLYAIGRAIWRPAAGAAAALAFVVLPITLAFANFNALEVPVMGWGLLATWGLVRLTQTGKSRHLVAALAGATLAMHADWPGFLLVGALLAFGLFRLHLLPPRVFGRLASSRAYGQWWALAASIAVLSFGFYLAMFISAGKLDDFFGSYGMRSSGNELPLVKVLEARRYWIELSFTPIAILLGKLAVPVVVARLVWLRREHEVVPLAWLFTSVVQYVVFKQGADIHVFWPQYFGAYFALAIGALVASLASALEVGWARVPSKVRAIAGAPWLLALAIVATPLGFVLRDGLPALVYARGTGGRFNEKGLLIHSDGAKTAFLKWLEPNLPRNATIGLHEGMKPTWAQVWALGGRLVAVNKPAPAAPSASPSPFLADTRFLLDNLQAQLASRFHVTAVGPFWKVVENEGSAPIDAFAIDEREPGLLEWYFMSGTEPHREIVPDAFLTWELRDAFGQAATPPADAPRGFDQLRVAHNLALARGDRAGADGFERDALAGFQPIGARFDDGSEIVAVRYEPGARPLLLVVLRAGTPPAFDLQLTVKSKVVARALLSTTMPDPLEREVGIPLPLAPSRWKPGFLYVDRVPIRKRPGTERFYASYYARGGRGAIPKRVDRPSPFVDLVELR